MRNWSKYKKIETGLYEVVNHWMTTNNPNKWLKRLWNDEEGSDFLKDTILSAIIEEFKSWSSKEQLLFTAP